MHKATFLALLVFPTVLSNAFVPSFMLQVMPSRRGAGSCQSTASSTICSGLQKCPAKTRTCVVILNAAIKDQGFNDLLEDDNHDCYYSVDTNMIIYYENGNLPGWVDYVNHMSAKGKRFFVTRTVFSEYNSGQKNSASLPSPFHYMKEDAPEALHRANIAYLELEERLNLTTKYENNAKWVLESGYCIAACPHIPVDANVARGKTFAITASAKLVQKLLSSPRKRGICETVIGKYGLEHLIDIRAVDLKTGAFQDIFAFQI